MAELTPMMQQYMETKKEYKDCILFYRLGDFYEMFFDDALTASKELEITLTGKNCGLEERAPMCGVPYHAVEGYLNRLVSKGYKVAIAEQMEELYGKIHALLSSFEQQVLTLYLSGHSYLEISQLLRTSPKAVDNALQRVRRKLRSV